MSCKALRIPSLYSSYHRNPSVVQCGNITCRFLDRTTFVAFHNTTLPVPPPHPLAAFEARAGYANCDSHVWNLGDESDSFPLFRMLIMEFDQLKFHIGLGLFFPKRKGSTITGFRSGIWYIDRSAPFYMNTNPDDREWMDWRSINDNFQ